MKQRTGTGCGPGWRWTVIVAASLALFACKGNDDPGAPEDPPNDEGEEGVIVARMVIIPGTNKPGYRFYKWDPPQSGPVFDTPGNWDQMDHPPPGFFDGARAAATSPGAQAAPVSSSAQAQSATCDAGVFTGGRAESGELSSTLAYVYDLTTEAFTVTQMTAARAEHQMTTLADGRVLVTGGVGLPSRSVALASAEIFDPISRSFTAVGSMHQARGFHSAAALDDGRVFISGAVFDNAAGWINTAEIFDP